MNHEQLQESLFELYDGELTNPRRREEVMAHLGDCTECREFCARWTQTAQILFGGPLTPASETFIHQVMARLPPVFNGVPDLSWRSFTRWALPLLGAAAAALLISVKAPLTADQEYAEIFSTDTASSAAVDNMLIPVETPSIADDTENS